MRVDGHEQETVPCDRGRKPVMFYVAPAIRVMEEPELRARLEAIDEIRAEHGLPPTPVDVEGREDYWALAKPYQTERPR